MISNYVFFVIFCECFKLSAFLVQKFVTLNVSVTRQCGCGSGETVRDKVLLSSISTSTLR